jgi:DNA-binding CsgD family transcriptional regulator
MEALANTPDDQINTPFQFGYYAELANATHLNALKDRISQIVKRLGVSDFSITKLSCCQTPQPELSTLAPEMMARYYAQALYVSDMNLQRAKENTEPFFHSSMHTYVARAPFSCDMTRCMQAINNLAKAYGYFDFYSIPLKAHQGKEQLIFTVSQRGMSPIELKRSIDECATDLQLLGEAIEFVTSQIFSGVYYNNTSVQKTVINPKPLRVLETLANNDLTINQIADKLCISVVTANQHLKTVRKSLGTHTNYAAIKQAILKGLIQFKEEKKFTHPEPTD